MYEDDDSLDKMKRGLYSRKSVRNSKRARREKSDESDGEDLAKDWEYKEPERPKETIQREKPKSNVNYLKIFFIISTVLLIVTAGTVFYKFFIAGSLISSRNVNIDIDGPTTARAGDEIKLTVSIENTNKSALSNPSLAMTFPENSLSSDESGEEMDRVVRELGTIEEGETVEEEFSVFLFGEEGEDIEIDLLLEYTTNVSSAEFSNEDKHIVRISSSPLSLLVAPSVDEAQSRDTFEIEIDASSNTSANLKDILVEAEYPGGFSFVSSNPSPIEGNNTWRIGDIEPRRTESITIEGYLEGQNNEERHFTFNSGVEGSVNGQIGRLYASSRAIVTITLPQLSLTTNINKSSAPTVSVSTGERVRVDINWENTTANTLQDLEIKAFLDSEFIERNSISVRNGFYQSAENTITWNQSTDSDLRSVGPRDNGSVSFSFETVGGNELGGASNPEIDIDVDASASEAQAPGNRRNVESELERVVRIASDLAVTQNLTYSSGPFTNSGPTPPRVEEETTYTVNWSVNNTGNTATDTTVRAALPAYVELVEVEDSASVSYSQLTNEVVWNVGRVEENTRGETTSFQISITPSSTQAGTAPTLVREAVIEGTDSFAGSTLRGSAESLNTEDLAEFGAGVVVE
ncbi:MAG: hypothetical protein U5L75_02645 [Candidatus Campbellbacteria bacterium]|nr:hypothetical protein [Candidatus Campbellbacteria bacterium]